MQGTFAAWVTAGLALVALAGANPAAATGATATFRIAAGGHAFVGEPVGLGVDAVHWCNGPTPNGGAECEALYALGYAGLTAAHLVLGTHAGHAIACAASGGGVVHVHDADPDLVLVHLHEGVDATVTCTY